MRKSSLLLLLAALVALLASCTVKEYENFQEMDNGSRLQKGGIVYSFYCALPDDSLRGGQIGIIDNDEKHKVYDMKGLSSDEWIIEYYDVIMSVYNVYKADTVTEIPDELK